MPRYTKTCRGCGSPFSEAGICCDSGADGDGGHINGRCPKCCHGELLQNVQQLAERKTGKEATDRIQRMIDAAMTEAQTPVTRTREDGSTYTSAPAYASATFYILRDGGKWERVSKSEFARKPR